MITVRQLLGDKHATLWSIGADDTVFNAISMMADHGIGALTVFEDQRLVGIVSERDYTTKVVLKDRASRETPVRDIMTANVITVTPDQTIRDCMLLMTEKRFRHLPVVEGDRQVGMVSIGDVLKG
ncbi:MAG: CBS domain-containing protein, partial [Gammaproteobacteria bacterium]|nr:CBS domain-containing protein [Gammaproteobacteria bacterium]